MLVSVTISPALVAEPVSSIAIQGMSKNTIEPEVKLVKLAICSRTNGVLRALVSVNSLAKAEVVEADGAQVLVASFFDNLLGTGVAVNHCCHGNNDAAGLFDGLGCG